MSRPVRCVIMRGGTSKAVFLMTQKDVLDAREKRFTDTAALPDDRARSRTTSTRH